ncbi:MAG TPA: peptidoglycan-binding protein [Roseiflexaceae bacterium]|nr:peptidoglycan-binding protein [Roseiflexaceae bacterium]
MLAKAQIINCITNESVVCMFNPKEYTFSKQNKWEEKPAKGKSVAHLEFSGGAPANLKLQLLFDTYEEHPGVSQAGDDVRKYTKGLWEMMAISEQSKDPKTKKGSPPHVRFEWGTLWSFEAVIESISQKFVLFDEHGTPLRAILDVSFRQIKDEGQYPRQNPSSGGNPGEHVRYVREGEQLSVIAYEEYGDARHWRYLAEINQISDPLSLRPGQMLIVQPLPGP